MLYFAYGSNLDFEQMKDRCPSASFLFTAKLNDHHIGFTRKSQKRNCGVADVISRNGQEVWGVVYNIDDHEIPKLDKCEGYRPDCACNAYERVMKLVIPCNDDGRPLTVHVYVANPESDPPPPSDEYLNLIIRGARRWKLPPDYIRTLEQFRMATNNLAKKN